MKRWPTKPLGDLCSVIAGGTPSRARSDFFDGGIPWVKIGDMLQGTVTKTEETISRLGLENSSAKLLPSGTVLISIFATIGRTAVLGIEAATNQAIAGVTPNNPREITPSFLRFFLDSAVATLVAESRGVAQLNINGKILKTLCIPIPPLAEQERIVRLLDEANALRKLRAQTDQNAKTLIPALFHEMFGDPTTNVRNWKRKEFSELLEGIDSGWSPVCQDRPANPDEWGVLKLGAVTTCQYRDTETKALQDSFSPRPELEVKVGDLLFTRKNTYELVAACAFVFETRPKLMLSDLLFRFRLKPNTEINPVFLWGLLTVPNKRKQVQAMAGGSAGSMPNISKGRLMTLPIELPPLSLQNEFAKRVTEIRELEANQATSRTRLDALFQSMLHRAFNGEL